MRFPWQPQEYSRTCAECGYTWRVPRKARRRQFGTIRGHAQVTFDTTDLKQAASVSGHNQWTESFRHCPKCGAEHFTERASRDQQSDQERGGY